MLNNIKKFLFGDLPNSDNNKIFYQTSAPPARAGLLRWNQRLKGDLWFDTSSGDYTPYLWDGTRWKPIDQPPVDA